MSQVTEQSVRFETALPSIKLIQASAVLDLTEDDFDFLTSNKVWRSEERFSRNAETDLVCRLLLEKKKKLEQHEGYCSAIRRASHLGMRGARADAVAVCDSKLDV